MRLNPQRNTRLIIHFCAHSLFALALIPSSLFGSFSPRSFAHTLFALSLILSSLFCSKLLILKSDRELFAQVALYKRGRVSYLLRLLFTKERLQAICSLKKSDVSDKLLIPVSHLQKTSKLLAKNNEIASKKRAKRYKKAIFLNFLTFSPLFMPKSNCSR